MKRRILFVWAVMLLSSCVNHIQEIGTKSVDFRIGFEISEEPISRALSDYIGSVEVFSFTDGEELIRFSQSASDTGFGSLQLELPFGSHNLVFVGHNSGVCNYSGEYLSFDKVTDTFTKTMTLEVNEETGGQQVALARQVAKLTITATDAIPDDASKIAVTVTGYSDRLNPTTGAGVSEIEHLREWTYSNDNIGEKGTNYILYTFLPTEGHTVNVTIRVTDKEGNIVAERTQQDVPVHKNRNTRLKGKLFETGVTTSFLVLSEWNDDVIIPF